jgi:pectate lyase
MHRLGIGIIVLAFACSACSSDRAPRSDNQSGRDPVANNDVLAFPGAAGHGRFAVGGRGGQVIRVTHLGDSGPGSLREAIDAEGPRTVVFDVSGYIDLESALDVNNGFLTMAGQTAPGDGITLRRHSLNIRADHVIVRYLRSRASAAARIETDAISVFSGANIIIDHCSASWATDETLSISPSDHDTLRLIDNVTVQWSIISESLNDSVHSKGPHGYGTLMRGSGGARYTTHHNLWAHHRARMPRPGNYIDRNTDPVGPLFDVRNNVFYNWGGSYSGYNADTESISRYSFVGNHYFVGPNSQAAMAFDESSPYASLYFAENFMNGELVSDATTVVTLPPGSSLAERDFDHGYTMPAAGPTAVEHILDFAGASLSRDAVDERTVGDVRARSGRIIDDVSDTPGWPVLESLPAPPDGDGDGMPDDWEIAIGLSPGDASDGPLDRNGDGYTNLEEYLNSLVPAAVYEY